MSNSGWIRRGRQGRTTTTPGADPHEPRNAAEIALIVLATLASLAALYLAKQVLAPLLMTVFLAELIMRFAVARLSRGPRQPGADQRSSRSASSSACPSSTSRISSSRRRDVESRAPMNSIISR